MIRIGSILLAFAACLLCLPSVVSAHEVRPGLLQLQETAPGQFDMLWRVPARGDQALSLVPRMPDSCETVGLPERYYDGLRSEERRKIVCADGLIDARITVEGLARVQTDVLVDISYLSGGSETLRATPQDPSVILTGQRSIVQVAATYFALGTEHILLGIDHLLFVTALLLLVVGWRRLLGTITAFTVAHSITLAAASLNILYLPSALVEALIALSIVVVAAEVVLANRGETGVAIKRPWLIAFGFGLLHGFGFAGALQEIGLPLDAVPTALLFFNLGVEAGQVAFVALVIVAVAALRNLAPVSLPVIQRIAPLVIGTAAGYWAVERTLAIWI